MTTANKNMYRNDCEKFDAKLWLEKYALRNKNRLSLKCIQHNDNSGVHVVVKQCCTLMLGGRHKEWAVRAYWELEFGRPNCWLKLNVKCEMPYFYDNVVLTGFLFVRLYAFFSHSLFLYLSLVCLIHFEMSCVCGNCAEQPPAYTELR